MDTLEKYKKYREISKILIEKIINTSFDNNILKKSGKLLGILKNDTFVFNNEEETDILMDFALNEYKLKDKNTIQIYKETVGGKNEIENEILNAYISSHTSLFKIISISQEENTLALYDILNKRYNIKLIDFSFSKTAFPGLILFIRIVPFKDFNITSGVVFAFKSNLKKEIIREYKSIKKGLKFGNSSIKRFIAFHQLNQDYGLEVRYR